MKKSLLLLLTFYPSGHMIYLNEDSLGQLH